jgi:hypothetical protein
MSNEFKKHSAQQHLNSMRGTEVWFIQSIPLSSLKLDKEVGVKPCP